MDLIEFKANRRELTGNGAARAIRRQGEIPAVLYGPKKEPVLLTVSDYDFGMLLKDHEQGQLVLDLKIGNGGTESHTVMIKEVQREVVSQNFLHIDFYEVDMRREITVQVPVTTVGHPPGVEMGGSLQIIRRELDVSCRPGRIPGTIEIDVSTMNIGDSVHVEELELPEDVEILYDTNFTVLTVVGAQREEVLEEEEALEEEEGEEPEDSDLEE